MDRFDAMQLFVRVVDTGSFSSAARAAGVAQATVSKQIAALERRLEAQLLRRTSRGLSLTAAGQDLYEASIRLLSDVEAVESRIGRGETAPAGIVRVAMSAGFGRMYVPRLPEFFARFPEITLDLEMSDRYVNLVEGSIDVAIRIGPLSDSSLLSHRIGSMEATTVAAPGYLERYGVPTAPSDLERHRCVTYMFERAPSPWHFKTTSGPFVLTPVGPLRTNDPEHLRAAAIAGLGIAHGPSSLFAADLVSGTLVRLLTDHASDPYRVHAVRARGRPSPRKVKVFVTFLREILASVDSRTE
jgi:LysR family transcriptional regulator for bpeEF and oprC